MHVTCVPFVVPGQIQPTNEELEKSIQETIADFFTLPKNIGLTYAEGIKEILIEMLSQPENEGFVNSISEKLEPFNFNDNNDGGFPL